MREQIPDCPNFFNKQDTRFRELQSTLDSVFHKLHSDGIGVQTKHTEILTKEDEEKLWKSGVMSLTTPESHTKKHKRRKQNSNSKTLS